MSTDRRMAEARRMYRLLRKADGVAAVSILAAAMVDAYEEGRADGEADGYRRATRSPVAHPDVLSRLSMLEAVVFGPKKEG